MWAMIGRQQINAGGAIDDRIFVRKKTSARCSGIFVY
jgi:hypothetical protein